MTFSCPFCTHEDEDFNESDEHLSEHFAEYQMAQEEEFGQYSK
jgi:hypothetical protein